MPPSAAYRGRWIDGNPAHLDLVMNLARRRQAPSGLIFLDFVLAEQNAKRNCQEGRRPTLTFRYNLNNWQDLLDMRVVVPELTDECLRYRLFILAPVYLRRPLLSD